MCHTHICNWDALSLYCSITLTWTINRGLHSISLVLLVFLKDFVEAPNNNDVCIVQVQTYIGLLTITRSHNKAAVVSETLIDTFPTSLLTPICKFLTFL